MCDFAYCAVVSFFYFLVSELRLVSGFWLWQILSNIFNLSYLLLHTKVWSQQLSQISHVWDAQSWILEHTHFAMLKSSVLIHRNYCVQKNLPLCDESYRKIINDDFPYTEQIRLNKKFIFLFLFSFSCENIYFLRI